MRRRGTILVGLCGGLLLCAGAGAVQPRPSAELYEGIAGRNAFGLRAPPTAPAPPQAEARAPEPPKIKLTGIMTLLGDKRALFKLLLPAQPGQQPKEDYLTLAEGQRKGNVEVLEIDEKAGTVKVDDFGTIMTVTFEKTPPPTASPGRTATTAPPGTAVPLPANPAENGANGYRSLPTRLPRLPVTGTSSAAATSTAAPMLPPTGYGPYGPEPTAQPPAGTATTAPQPEPPLTPEEELLLEELQKALAQPEPTVAPPARPPATGVLPPGADNRQRLRPPLLPQ